MPVGFHYSVKVNCQRVKIVVSKNSIPWPLRWKFGVWKSFVLLLLHISLSLVDNVPQDH